MANTPLQSLQSTTTRLFTAFATNPKNLHFEHQGKNETVILFLRQHLITLVPTTALAVIMALAPTILFPLIFKLFSASIHIPVGYIIVGILFWYLATFGIFFSRLLYWFFNIFIVTNERIIDIDFINLLYKDVSETQISRVQDISYNSKGIFAALFNYGDVMIQTAGELPNFAFELVPKPSDVVEIISNVAKTEKDHKPV
jgi:uncharacterized membrane protein YdbT with pleckstrin-like domain